jgi:hypothetical protein
LKFCTDWTPAANSQAQASAGARTPNHIGFDLMIGALQPSRPAAALGNITVSLT